MEHSENLFSSSLASPPCPNCSNSRCALFALSFIPLLSCLFLFLTHDLWENLSKVTSIQRAREAPKHSMKWEFVIWCLRAEVLWPLPAPCVNKDIRALDTLVFQFLDLSESSLPPSFCICWNTQLSSHLFNLLILPEHLTFSLNHVPRKAFLVISYEVR